MTASVFETAHTILSSDVDAAQRLRLSSLFVMLQEAAIAHTTALDMGKDKTLDKGLLWVVTLEELRIERLPRYDEPVVLTTWPGRNMHLFFPRYFRMNSANGTFLLDASSVWGLMDASTRSLVFPEEHGIRIDEAPEAPLPMPKRPVLPEMEEAGVFTVPWSYTDLNGHMNNTRYFDLAEDRMPPSLRKKEIRRIRVEFSAEAAEGTDIRLYAAASENTYCMEGKTEGGSRGFRLALDYA